MRHRTSRLLAAGIVTLTFTSAQAASPGAAAPAAKLLKVREPVRGEYIVVLKKAEVKAAALKGSEDSRGVVTRFSRELSERHGGKPQRVYHAALQGFSATMSEAQALRLSEDPRVAYVEENGVIHPGATRSTTVGTPPATQNVWGLDRIDQRDLPLNQTYTFGARGAHVHAYIIDTGITSHQDFSGQLSPGFNAVGDAGGTGDCGNRGNHPSHGTHVAGTVGGQQFGVAPGVSLHPVRVFPCTTGASSDVIAGVDWVADNHLFPAVANMSLGGSASQSLDDAVEGLIDSGVVTIVSAGNDGVAACTQSPARLPAAITVGASNDQDAVAGFSNHGSCVDLFAPGVGIRSTLATPVNGVGNMSGTSMAAPHVTGAAALYLQRHPGSTQQQVRDFLVGEATTGRLTGLPAGSPDRLLFTGGINSFLLNVASAQPPVGNDGHFEAADWNGDKRPDLFFIQPQSLTGFTEVHILSGATDYQTFLGHWVTALHTTNADWAFEVGDWNNDGSQDVFAIQRAGATATEVHILSGATGFQTFLAHTSTALHTTTGDWDFKVTDWNKDGTLDVVALNSQGAGGHVEVHILSGATGLQTFLLNTTTALPSAGSWEYELAEVNGDATVDLVGILRSGGSNSTEVHAVSGASGFSSFVLQAGTALHPTNGDWTFEMVRWDDPNLFGFELLGNGPDLVAINRNGPLAVEVHILNP
ncbi:S8 family serine peptidase [Myxococcus vastator]|uniref:S8 family serine peptidase n=1 Tax=Myxococcus vastator TaxID=2709664 RepID=UPI001967EE78|nr:S8 family serine peptidase [Myxococcus vastator]